MSQTTNTTAALTFGNLAAAYVSWTVNRSVGWAIVHGILSWFYVIYHFVVQS